MLRLFIAWRLLRIFRPLALCGLLALALGVVLHGQSPLPPIAQRPLTQLNAAGTRSLWPLVLSARHTLTLDRQRALR